MKRHRRHVIGVIFACLALFGGQATHHTGTPPTGTSHCVTVGNGPFKSVICFA